MAIHGMALHHRSETDTSKAAVLRYLPISTNLTLTQKPQLLPPLHLNPELFLYLRYRLLFIQLRSIKGEHPLLFIYPVCISCKYPAR